MSKTILRVTERELLLGLAYLAAAFSYLAYQNSQEAKHRAWDASDSVHQLGYELEEHRNAVEAEEDDLDDEDDE